MKTKTREGSVEVPAAPEASTRVVGVPAQSVSAAGYVLRGALFLTAFAGLVLLSRGNYLLFHAFVEGFSIVIAFGIFFIAWNSRDFLENNYLLFLGLIYPFVGFLDFLHVLSYAGMGVFAGYGADLPTQLWIQARYMESVSLLLAALFFHRRVRPHLVLPVYAGATILLLLSIFTLDIFPVCFSETGGLTTFKKVSEYVIVAVLAAALVPVVRNRANLSRTMFWFLSGSILATMVSELFFTFYVSVYGLSNMLGHLLKILSFYCVYKGLIEASLRDPYNNLFLNLKRSEEDLLRAKADLQQKNEALESFIYAAGHDLKSPLASALGFTQLLAGSLPPEADGRRADMFGRVQRNLKRMDHMLRDLLEYARIGQEKDDASPLDLRELLNQILDEKRQEMEAVQAEVIVSDALPPLRMSETRAYQVFMNLLTNSLKFRREGVAPRIEIGVAEEADKNSSHRVFFFRDNGKGIGDRDIGKVFNLFTSFGGFDQGGTGAGLAIVKRIVDLRGGTIRVESRTEEGTTFIFSLPVAHPLD